MKDEDFKLGQRIKSIRLGDNKSNKKYKQKEFAEMINATVQALSNWENGRNKPNDFRLQAIADFAGISVNELLYGEPKAYLDNLLWNSELLDDFGSHTFDKFFDNLKKSVVNDDDLYLTEEEAVNQYKRFSEQNKLEENVDPLGYSIYSALENKENPHAVQIFLTEADNNFSLLFGKSLKDAYDDYTNELNNKK